MIETIEQFLPPLLQLHRDIRTAVITATEHSNEEAMSAIAHDDEGDTIFAIDKVSEEKLISFIADKIAIHTPVILIAEGLAGGQIVLPEGADPKDANWRIIVDPIDGTRGLMYQKRSGWILTGVAPNKGSQTSLADIELAVQTEIPLVKQHLSDVLWAIKGHGTNAIRHNRLTGEERPLPLHPSRQPTIHQGFAQISRFFPGVREELAAIDEEIVFGALGPVQQGKTHCFEDQYISTGGQLYEVMVGHDRFVADIRPLMEKTLQTRGYSLGICCHPYDLCTQLIAQELGVIVTNAHGNPANAPLDVETDVDWVAYANKAIQQQMEPLLQNALKKRNLFD